MNYPIILQPSFPYRDFLMHEQYVGDIKNGITEATKDIIKAKALSSQIIKDTIEEDIDYLATIIDSNFAKLNRGVDRVSLDIQNLHSGFNIAMGKVILQFEMQREEMKQGLDSIIDILKNRRKIDASEDFRDAMEFYNDGCRFIDKPVWMKNAHKYFISSIEKYERNPLAHLHLAHIYHYQEEFRDFSKALYHYELCYTYGEADEKSRAVTAQGYFYAGWLKASVFDDIDSAIKLTKEAIEYDSSLDKAYYHLSKFYALEKDILNSLYFLKKNIVDFDRSYTVKAKLDSDFDAIRDSLDKFLQSLRDKSFEKLTMEYDSIQKKIDNFEMAKEDYNRLKRLYNTVKIKSSNTYFENLDYISSLEKSKLMWEGFNLKERDRLKEEILEFVESVNYTYKDIFQEFIEYQKRVEKLFKSPQTYKRVLSLHKKFLKFTLKDKNKELSKLEEMQIREQRRRENDEKYRVRKIEAKRVERERIERRSKAKRVKIIKDNLLAISFIVFLIWLIFNII